MKKAKSFQLDFTPLYMTIVADIKGSRTAIELYGFNTKTVKQASGYNEESWSFLIVSLPIFYLYRVIQ